jgi:hypothetical protein
MHSVELNTMLQQHKVWLETKGANGIHANLPCGNLDGANLSYANLRDAGLYHANLRGADLRDANLRDANLAGANLTGVSLQCAVLTGAILTGAILNGVNFNGTNLSDANGLPDISWIKPGGLVELNHIIHDFYLKQEGKYDNFIQGSFGMIVQENFEEKTFDVLVEDRIIRGVPEWVKYSGLNQNFL